MEVLKELAELVLPEGILKYFEYTGYKKENKEITITLIEKNVVPPLPEEYRERRVSQKGFKENTVNDFPIRGKKVKLLFRKRMWKIDGVEKLYQRKIEVLHPGTKLEKEFAAFLKGGD